MPNDNMQPLEIEILLPTTRILSMRQCCDEKHIEYCGRVAYQSHDKITEHSHIAMIHRLRELGHTSVLEHSLITVEFFISRGVADELMRHRLTAITCQSTRYCDFENKRIQFTLPFLLDTDYLGVWDADRLQEQPSTLVLAYYKAAQAYKELRLLNWAPQHARDVLPLGIHTHLVVTANAREWNHIFSLRCAKDAHPAMRRTMLDLRDSFRMFWPSLFNEQPHG